MVADEAVCVRGNGCAHVHLPVSWKLMGVHVLTWMLYALSADLDPVC